MDKIDILGVKIDKLTQAQVLEKIVFFSNRQIITANPEIVLKAWQNEDYQNLINGSAMVVADGIGLLWAAKFLSLPNGHLLTTLIQMMVSGASLVFYPDYVKDVLPERISGVDLMEKICEQAGQKNWKVYLLGGEEGIAKKAAEVLKSKYINLSIVGTDTGPIIDDASYKLFENDREIDALIKNINNAATDILFVAMGSPKQDIFINYLLRYTSRVQLAMGVGGAFDFISGKVKRAPIIYQDLGIEWLWRLFNQPWRFFRIFNATVKFIWTVIKFKQITSK